MTHPGLSSIIGGRKFWQTVVCHWKLEDASFENAAQIDRLRSVIGNWRMQVFSLQRLVAASSIRPSWIPRRPPGDNFYPQMAVPASFLVPGSDCAALAEHIFYACVRPLDPSVRPVVHLFSLISGPLLCPRRESQSITYLWRRTKKPIFSLTTAIFPRNVVRKSWNCTGDFSFARERTSSIC